MAYKVSTFENLPKKRKKKTKMRKKYLFMKNVNNNFISRNLAIAVCLKFFYSMVEKLSN